MIKVKKKYFIRIMLLEKKMHSSMIGFNFFFNKIDSIFIIEIIVLHNFNYFTCYQSISHRLQIRF